jgi:hypothetical protein
MAMTKSNSRNTPLYAHTKLEDLDVPVTHTHTSGLVQIQALKQWQETFQYVMGCLFIEIQSKIAIAQTQNSPDMIHLVTESPGY